MKVGKKAPDFTLPDGEGSDWTLTAQKGKTVVLLFYPGDNIEALTMDLEILIDRTSLELFADKGKFTIISPLPESRNNTGFEFGGNIKIHALEIHELKSVWLR